MGTPGLIGPIHLFRATEEKRSFSEATRSQNVRESQTLAATSVMTSFEEKRRDCIAACTRCATACEQCAAALLREEDPKPVAGIIALARACADVCLLSARLLAQGSEFVEEYCALNAEVCHTYRKECLKQSAGDECRQYAEIALKCEQACQQIAM
jgi:hypothetical protein